MVKAILLFALGLVFLIKGGDWFVDGATGIAHRFHIPEILIGATVVSIGTTLPEVMVSATSAVSGHGQIAYGNAIGSIICNAALIAAITLTFKPGKVDRAELKTPVLFFFSSAVFYVIVAYAFKRYDRWVGIVLLLVFIAYITLNVVRAMKISKEQPEQSDTLDGSSSEEEEKKSNPLWKEILFLIIGAALIAVGADLLVDNGTIIAEGLGVPESVIALTFVALGTSLPELVTAITSLVKGHGSLSLGNVIGANLFNLVLVSGVSVTLNPFIVPNESQIAGLNTSFVVELPLMLGCMLLLTIPPLVKGKLYRWQGISLLLIYVGFCAFQFIVN